MKNKTPIIPFFLHYLGCPNQCIYCNQTVLNDSRKPLDSKTVYNTLKKKVEKDPGTPFCVAYYGASFTLLPEKEQYSFLKILEDFPVEALYISTRPDGINSNAVQNLKKYKLRRVELGVQSLDDSILKRCRRTYKAMTVKNSLDILSSMNIERSAHLMAGLPGQTEESILQDVRTLINWGITHIRIHPVLVLKDTVLAQMYTTGSYMPWSLDRSATLCARIIKTCKENSVKILRLGVQPSPSLEKKGSILAGPYHPSFGEICYSYYYRSEIEKFLSGEVYDRVRIRYAEKLRSKVIGPNKMNQHYFQDRYPESHLIFEEGLVQEIQIDGGIRS